MYETLSQKQTNKKQKHIFLTYNLHLSTHLHMLQLLHT